MRHATFIKHATNWQQLNLKICKTRKHCVKCYFYITSAW